MTSFGVPPFNFVGIHCFFFESLKPNNRSLRSYGDYSFTNILHILARKEVDMIQSKQLIRLEDFVT